MLLVTIVAARAADCTALGGLVLNEFSYETGAEWVELYNPGTAEIQLGGVVIEWGTSSWSESSTLPEGAVVGPADYYVVGVTSGVDLALASFDLGNATSYADGIRLTCDGTPVDVVIYGSSNADNAFTDESGLPATSVGPTLSAGQSATRVPDGWDTNASGADFVACDVPSPGGPTACVASEDTDPPTPLTCAAPREIVINEFNYNAPEDWVELYNNSAQTWVLDGWTLEFGSSEYDDEIALEGEIAPGVFLVVGELGSSNVLSAMDLGNAGSSADGLRLRCGDVVLDTVIYGEPNSDGWLDDTLLEASSLAPTNSGGSVIRHPDGADSDYSADDFFACDEVTPGEPNACAPPECDGADGVRLNEFTYDTDDEWVELYNGGATLAHLSGWTLEDAGSDGAWGGEWVLPEGVTIAPGEFLVLGRDGALLAGSPVPVDVTWEDGDFDPGNAGSSPDGIRLACRDETVDSLVYGDTSDLAGESWTEDDGADVEALAGKLGSDEAYERNDDGVDTQRSGADWLVCDDPSPGEPNRCEPPPPVECHPDLNLVINEVLFDNESSDDDEWVEIHNAGSDTALLEGWVLEVTSSTSWNDKLIFERTIEIPAGGYLVIGNGSTADVVASLSLGNASSNADGVRLLSCGDDPEVVDTVVYGSEPGEGFDELGWESPPTPVPDDPDQSLSRIPDGNDETNGQSDWQIDGSPTPGEANDVGDDGDDDTGEDSGSDDDKLPPCTGCSCDCERPEVSAGDYGRTAMPLLGLGGLAALLRRRRGVRSARDASRDVSPADR